MIRTGWICAMNRQFVVEERMIERTERIMRFIILCLQFFGGWQGWSFDFGGWFICRYSSGEDILSMLSYTFVFELFIVYNVSPFYKKCLEVEVDLDQSSSDPFQQPESWDLSSCER